MTKDTQAARENLLIQWSSLKQTKNESVSGFASRVLDMREERELINMNVSDDEVKAIFRRGLRSPDLALWALDRATLPVSKFLSAVISHADEMVRLGVTTSTLKNSQSERKICKFFARTGSCKFGDHCRYKHITTNDDGVKKQTDDESKSSTNQPVSAAPTKGVSSSSNDDKVIQRDKPTCYICKRPGHLARNCPNKQASPLKATEDVTPTSELPEDDDVVGAISYEEVKPRIWSAIKIPITVTSPSSLSKTVHMKALVDTGANKNYLSKNKAALVCNALCTTTLSLEAEHVSKQVDGAPLRAKEQIKLRVSLIDVSLEDPVLSFYILDKISPEVILGITGLQQLGLNITLQGGITIQQSYVPQFLSTSFVTDESEDEVAVIDDTEVAQNEQIFEEPTDYCQPHIQRGPLPKKEIGYEEALQALMKWQPVRSAPDYSFRVCPIGEKKKDTPNQRYYFEIYIPIKKSHHKCRRKYDYSSNLLSKLSSSDRESYFSEIDQYISRQWWKPLDSTDSFSVNVPNSVSPIITFPVVQPGRGIRPCADCRETNKCCPVASYKGDSISRIFCKTTTQWRSDYSMICIDAKKAFYRVHLYSPLPVTTNSCSYFTMRMSFGLACGCAGLESCLLSVLELARLRCPDNDVLQHRTYIYIDDISFCGLLNEVLEARTVYIQIASEFGYEFGKFKDICPVRNSLGPIVHLGLIWSCEQGSILVRCRHDSALEKFNKIVQDQRPLTKRRCFAISGLAIDSVIAHGPLSVAADVLRSISGRSSGDWDTPLQFTEAESAATNECINIIKKELSTRCAHGFAGSDHLDFVVTSDASPYGYGWQVTVQEDSQQVPYEYNRARVWRRGQRRWHINRQELFALCDVALLVDELVTDALLVGKKCSICFKVDSNAAARWVTNNKILCKTLERHAINRLVGIFSDLSQEWRRNNVQVSVVKIKGEENTVADKLSRLVYDYGMVDALYGKDEKVENFPDSISPLTENDEDNDISSSTNEAKPKLSVAETAKYDDDLTVVYNNLLLFKAFRAWKILKWPQYAQIKELTTEIGGQARKWLREWQRGSHSLRGVYDRVFHNRSTSNRYNEVRSFGGPHYSITSDGILTELRYPYGDILAVPYECYLLPTDDINILESIILFYHERGGHSNSRQTRWRIGRTFRWPHMRRDIDRVCRSCTRCQFVAAYRRSRTIRRHLDSSSRLPWQVVSVDLLGPLKKDLFNMQYVLVAICHMSRFVVLTALKDASTKSVTNALRDTWCLWGRPITLRADNGPAFRGVFKTEMAKDGVYVSSISRYSPWSNGICERVMATIKSYIKGLNKSDSRRWSKFMPLIARKLNTKQLPEGKSPYEILFGRPYPEELECRMAKIDFDNEDDNQDEAIHNLKKQQDLIISEVLQDRERRDSPQDPRLITVQPPIGSMVIRVPPRDRSGPQQQDRQVYEVVKVLNDGVTVFIRPVNSIVNSDESLNDSDVVREHSSNLKRFWGASCDSQPVRVTTCDSTVRIARLQESLV